MRAMFTALTTFARLFPSSATMLNSISLILFGSHAHMLRVMGVHRAVAIHEMMLVYMSALEMQIRRHICCITQLAHVVFMDSYW